MAQELWCWRCRKVVPMLEPHEWVLVDEARAAGAKFATVLERAREKFPGHDFTPIHTRAGVGEQQFAPLVLVYEFFTGVREPPLRIPHHRSSLYGPPCTACGKPLRTAVARYCVACGQPRERDAGSQPGSEPPACTPGLVRLHAPNLRTMTIADALIGPLPLEDEAPFLGAEYDPLLGALADPAFGLVQHSGIRHLVDPLAVPSEPARMVKGLFAFQVCVLGDRLSEYLRQEDGDELPDVLQWCEQIGATRAQSFAHVLLDLYPQTLHRDHMARSEVLDALDDEEGHDVAQQLASTRWDDVIEISDRLRSFVRSNLATFEEALQEGREVSRQTTHALRRGKPEGMSEMAWLGLLFIRD